MPPLSLYIHIPWCLKKCPYCDFNSHARPEVLPEARYVAALLADLAAEVRRYPTDRRIASVFIGGGTPSLFTPDSIAELLAGADRLLGLEDGAEVTLEANPGTFDSVKFAEFRAAGVNRLSIGVQSFNDRLLAGLGRAHSGSQARRAVAIARQAGFTNYNLDLMFGLPGAGLADGRDDIATAIGLQPSHISHYQLTLEPNTYFHRFPPKLPDDDLIDRSQRRAQALLAAAGFQRYEISAYAQPGSQCLHNKNYWRFGDYLGIGAGAHGKLTLSAPLAIVRTAKPKSPQAYLADPAGEGARQPVAVGDLPLEFMMNQLRLRQGFTASHYQAATGLPLSTLEPALSQCLRQGLLRVDDGRYACGDRGWAMLDSLLQMFIAAP